MVEKGIYEHYKGKCYRVIGLGQHEETLEKFVVYTPLYETDSQFEEFWLRPLSNFKETIDLEGKQVPRFKLVEKEDI